MKKSLIALGLGLLLVPTFSFASVYVTLDQFTYLQTRVTTLENEVLALQTVKVGNATAAPTQPTSGTPSISASFVSQSISYSPSRGTVSGSIGSSEDYNLTFTVTASGQSIYIPLTAGNLASNGIDYFVTGPGTAQASASAVCTGSRTSVVTAAGVSYCLVPNGTTSTFYIYGSVNGITSNGYAVGISSINFKTNPSDTTYYTYTPPNNLKTKTP